MIDLQDTDQIVFCDTESFAHNWSDWGMPNMNDLPLMSSSHQSYIAVFIEYSLFFSATPIKGLHSPHRRGTDQSVLRSHDHPPHTWSRTSFSSLKTHGGYKNVRRGVDELNLINLLCLWYLTGHLNHLLIHVRYWSDHHTDIHIVVNIFLVSHHFDEDATQ